MVHQDWSKFFADDELGAYENVTIFTLSDGTECGGVGVVRINKAGTSRQSSQCSRPAQLLSVAMAG